MRNPESRETQPFSTTCTGQAEGAYGEDGTAVLGRECGPHTASFTPLHGATYVPEMWDNSRKLIRNWEDRE